MRAVYCILALRRVRVNIVAVANATMRLACIVELRGTSSGIKTQLLHKIAFMSNVCPRKNYIYIYIYITFISLRVQFPTFLFDFKQIFIFTTHF